MADAAPAPPLLLASRSPQRRAILEQLGLPFEVVAPQYDEEHLEGVDAAELVRTHARAKARSVADAAGDRPVLGVDTEVVLDGRTYGKPGDATEAEAIGEGGKSFRELVSELEPQFPIEAIEEALKRLLDAYPTGGTPVDEITDKVTLVASDTVREDAGMIRLDPGQKRTSTPSGRG